MRCTLEGFVITLTELEDCLVSKKIEEASPTPSEWKKLGMRRHFWMHVIFMAALLVVWISMHGLLATGYTDSSEEEAISAAQAYQIDEDEEGKLVLYVAGQRADAIGGDVAGPLGMGKRPAFTGILVEAQRRIEASNRALEGEMGSLLSRFSLKDLGFGARATDLFSTAEKDWFVYLDHDPAKFGHGLVGSRQLVSELRAADMRYLKTRTSAALDLVPANDEGFVSPRLDLRRDDGSRLGVVVAGVEGALARTQRDVESLTCPESGCLSESPVTCLHKRLVGAMSWGYFWLFGGWLCIEVFFLTMLGVMVEAMVRFGLHLVRRTNPPNQIWDPAETGRTGLKLLYAPITGAMAIWLMVATDVLDVGIAGIGSAPVILILAFLFGLFPNLPFAIFVRVAEATFQRTSVAAKSPTGKATMLRVHSLPVASGAPSFGAFKKKAKEHATAFLRNGNPS